MRTSYREIVTVPGEAHAVFPMLVEAANRSGRRLFVNPHTWSVRVSKGPLLLANTLCSREVSLMASSPCNQVACLRTSTEARAINAKPFFVTKLSG